MRILFLLRRMVLCALALCLILASAAVADTNDFTFTLDESGSGYQVTGYSGGESSITVPDWYDGLPVTEIGKSAFMGQTGIETVALPSTIVRIGASAFKGCTNLYKLSKYTASDEPPVTVRVPGDADDDGKVNAFDVLLLLQYEAGWNVSPETDNADVDASGGIAMDDILLILRYCAGEDVTLK